MGKESELSRALPIVPILTLSGLSQLTSDDHDANERDQMEASVGSLDSNIGDESDQAEAVTILNNHSSCSSTEIDVGRSAAESDEGQGTVTEIHNRVESGSVTNFKLQQTDCCDDALID